MPDSTTASPTDSQGHLDLPVLAGFDARRAGARGSERFEAWERLRVLESVFAAMREGAVVTDPGGHILAVNPAFTRITGYTAAEAVGRTPSLLNSGRHDAAFYERFWGSIVATGEWRGDLWNRRKDGQVYPERLAVTTVPGADGTPLFRVGVFADLTDEKLGQERLWRQANFDPLTGLANRGHLLERLEAELERARGGQASVALLVIDIDEFKEVNDVRGHAFGDRVLAEVACRLAGCAGKDGLLGRLGADEFAIAVPRAGEEAKVEGLLARLLACLARPHEVDGVPAYLPASIGVAYFPADGADGKALLARADQALIEAKAAGGNTFRCFARPMQEATEDRVALTNELRGALVRGELEVWYQPILEITTGRLVKAEALLRWRHPVRGFVSPAKFVPIAEQAGLIHEIGDHVFREAAQAIARWCHLGPGEGCDGRRCGFQVGINMSPRQFTGSCAALGWARHLESLGVCPASMNIEITEGLLLEEGPEVQARLLALREAGFQLSIDDFGTRYSSFAYLRRFRIDYVKIDRSFISEIETDAGSRAIVEAMIVMAHKLGQQVVAEGVETRGQLERLAQSGCDFAQGYLFHRPMPAAEFTALLAGLLRPRFAGGRTRLPRNYPRLPELEERAGP